MGRCSGTALRGQLYKPLHVQSFLLLGARLVGVGLRPSQEESGQAPLALTVPSRGSVTGDFYCLGYYQSRRRCGGVSIVWCEAWGKILAWE